MKNLAVKRTQLRTGLRPSCLAIALALGTLALDPAVGHAEALDAAWMPPAAELLQRRDAPGLSDEQRLAVFERALTRQAYLPKVSTAAIAVTNCNDSGAGSYRQAMADARDGDTIDLTATGCSSITLTSGDVAATSANNLTLQGPGQLYLTINGDFEHSQVRHTGTGVLTIRDLTLFRGEKYVSSGGLGKTAGGCASTEGTLVMINAGAKYCEVRTPRNDAGVKGGALYAKVGMELTNSVVSGNTALATGSLSHVSGGGAFSAGFLTMANTVVSGNLAKSSLYASGGGVSVGAILGNNDAPGGTARIFNSTISGNQSDGPDTKGQVGGLFVLGDLQMSYSTVSGNVADSKAAVYLVPNSLSPPSSSIFNTTISGNRSTRSTAGLTVHSGPIQVSNTTIAFNSSGDGTNPAGSDTIDLPGAGMQIKSGTSAVLRSTIISDNTTWTINGVYQDDLGRSGSPAISGSNNLIPARSVGVPSDTRTGDAMLQPLADNGGFTKTHRLGAGSAAIDRGINPLMLATDQRGGGFPRVVGAQADIGAFESGSAASGDSIFSDGFE